MQRTDAYKNNRSRSHPMKKCSPLTPLPSETGLISRKKTLPMKSLIVAAILLVRMDLNSGAALEVFPRYDVFHASTAWRG